MRAGVQGVTRKQREVFTLDDAVNLTRNLEHIWNVDRNDNGGSDGGGTETAAGQMA